MAVSDDEGEEEDDGENEEEVDTDCEEEEVSEGEDQGEFEEEEEEMEMRGAGEMGQGGENEVERGYEEMKRGDEEEDREVIEVDERVEAEEEEEDNEVEAEVMENGVFDEEKEVKTVEELEEGEEEGEKMAEMEVEENKKGDEEEDSDLREADEMEEEQEGGENKGEGEAKNKELDAEEEREAMEAEVGEEEKEVMEAEEIEEEEQEERKNEFERNVKGNEEVEEDNDRQVKGEQQVEDNNEEGEHQEQEQIGQDHRPEQFRQQIRTEGENIQQNEEGTSREQETANENENSLDSEECDDEDSDFTGCENECYNFERIRDEESAVEKQYKDPEELKDPDEKSWRDENSMHGSWTFQERKEEEDESEKLADEETATESWTTQEEEFEDDNAKPEEEESTDDEEAEHSADEDVDYNDEDVVKIYSNDDYPTDIFSTLTKFRDSSLLTDLTLSTEDGKSFHVHSPVMAAVSSLIWESLSTRNVENDAVDERKNGGVHRWSVSLDPEVDHVGLEAVVKFAYTGLVSGLNKDTVHQIKAAAQTMGAPRVLELCTKEVEKLTKTGGQEKEEGISAAEQMMISLQSIKQLWMDRLGCDVILEALGGSLHAHRVILAVGSDYFRSMFTLGMRESHQSHVTLPFLLASELEVLIDCSYSGDLPLSWRCVFEITTTALQLQYQPALSLCLSFLQQEINPHSCLDLASFAEAYEMVQLQEVADDFVLRQFPKVACTSKFKDLPAKQLLRYLNSHSLCVSSELVVFRAVVGWIQARPKKRLKLAKELMKTIHFPLMTFKEFKEVQSLNMWSDHSLAELYEAVFEDFCSNDTAPQSQCRIYLPKESLVLIGGDQTSEDLGSRSISKELWFGNSLMNHTGIKKAMEWRRLGEMPDPPRFSHEVTVINGQLYVFGGKKYYGTGDTLNSVYRYDPLQNSWESLAEMQEKRCSFSVVVLDGKIYAIGGHCDPEYIETVERYCPISNSWSFVWPLDLPLCAHVAKVLHGQVFVSGGLSNNYQCLASMFLYHPETGSMYLANMAKPRANHCMETLGECLYVAGGITTNNNVTFVDQLACEVYNPVADSWTAFTALPVPHVGAGSAVLEGKFYVLGGYSQEDYSDTKMVHRYDPTTQRWENMGKMPGPNNDIRASLLCLPPNFRL
ncbi:uncharacterized protein LOC143317446 [Chaetodon auriga]|uniref:uncharacterized protein LOC143317446 n=1 Tax=Chaetodon auriga TaxID=39042 RepID=UPI0040328F65